MDLVRRLVGILILLSALAIPLVRQPDLPVEGLVARWAQPPSEFMDLDGQLVHYRDEGPKHGGVPIVLIHGTSASLHTWDGWAQALRAQRRVIRLDLPGFGLTGPFTGTWAGQDYTSTNDARFVLAVLDHLGVQRFAIAGNSLGGEVAWRIAAAAPQRVAALVLVDAAGYPIQDASIPLGWQFARLPILGGLAEHLLPRPMIVQGLTAVYGDPAKITEPLVDRYFDLTLRAGNRAALVQRARSWTSDQGVQQVTGVGAPTLILWGGRIIVPATARRFAKDIPGSLVQVFDDLGHVPHEEDPARTVAPVQAFLRSAVVSRAAGVETEPTPRATPAAPRTETPAGTAPPAPRPSRP